MKLEHGFLGFAFLIAAVVAIAVPELAARAARVLLVVIAVALGAALYWLPTYIAARRNHRQLTAIAVLNTLGGWSTIGWIVALVWAVTKSTR
jgi:hypothetical protein